MASLIKGNKSFTEGYTKDEIDHKLSDYYQKSETYSREEANSKMGDYKAKDDFAVITGELSIEATGNAMQTLQYPANFEYANSVVISYGITTNNDSHGKGYNYYGIYADSSDGLDRAYKRRINLKSDGIKIVVYNPNGSAMTVNYKIVLMKI